MHRLNDKEARSLEEILLKYTHGESKEELIEKAFYTDKFRLLYDWVYLREISLIEFVTLLKKIKDCI